MPQMKSGAPKISSIFIITKTTPSVWMRVMTEIQGASASWPIDENEWDHILSALYLARKNSKTIAIMKFRIPSPAVNLYLQSKQALEHASKWKERRLFTLLPRPSLHSHLWSSKFQERKGKTKQNKTITPNPDNMKWANLKKRGREAMGNTNTKLENLLSDPKGWILKSMSTNLRFSWKITN